MMIMEKVQISDQVRIAGGFSDIREGIYRERLVAVKTLRVSPTEDLEKMRKVCVWLEHNVRCNDEYTPQQFCKEVILWNSLSHPNILKMIGVLERIDERDFSTISEWMNHGSIIDYVRDCHHNPNRLELVRAIPSAKFTTSLELYHSCMGLHRG